MTQKIDLLEAALKYLSRGWGVIPLRRNKRPFLARWATYQSMRATEQELTDWWEKWPDANIGIVTGAISGIVVLDVDPRHGGQESLDELKIKHETLPDTLNAFTGGFGLHLYFAHPGYRLKNRVAIAPGLDVRADGGYVVAPPSVHASGNTYEWDISGDIQNVSLAPCPEWLIEKLTVPARECSTPPQSQVDPVAILAGVPEGQRDNRLFQYACRLRAKGMSREEATALLIEAANNCDPPFPEQEALQKVESAWKYPPGKAQLEAKRLEPPEGFTAAELMEKEFKDPVWAIPGILPEGLTLQCGKPKVGKSWLALNLAVAIACGGQALGKIEVEQGRVLYLALEDSPRRLRDRLSIVLQGAPPPENIHLFPDWPKSGTGGKGHLKEFLENHPDTRLVIVDTLAKIRPATKSTGNLYAQDYEALEGFKRLADQYGVALLIIHHLRKMASDDVFDQVSGTTGLTGAADTLLVLERTRGRADAVLTITGRDVEENQLALQFDRDNCCWELLGDAEDYRYSKQREEILQVLKKSERPRTPKEVSEILKRNQSTVRWHLSELANQGLITRVERGKYTITNNANKPTTPTNQRTNVGIVGVSHGYHQQS